MSGLGKGVTASSIGVILKNCGHRVTSVKIGAPARLLAASSLLVNLCSQSAAAADPYLNTDAGTMSPFEHGEVFVLDDGGEVRSAAPFPCMCSAFIQSFPYSQQRHSPAGGLRSGQLRAFP